MKILVTGGAGFIGSNFVKYVFSVDKEVDIVVLDKFTYAGNYSNLLPDLKDPDSHFPRLSIVEGDICDPIVVAKAMEGCDVVVNFAAETHVDRSIYDSSSFIKTDVLGTHVLLERARFNNVKLFLQMSTDEVYGDALHREGSQINDPLMPKSPYAASKAGADRLVYSYGETYGLKNIIVRACNAFGPFQYPEKLIPVTIKRLLEGMPVPVYGDGNNTREWIYVDDLCNIIWKLIVRHHNLKSSSIQHISSGKELSVLEMVRNISTILGIDPTIKFIKDRPGHVKRHAIYNTSTIPGEFINDLLYTVNWYKDNQDWIKLVTSTEEYTRYVDQNYTKR